MSRPKAIEWPQYGRAAYEAYRNAVGRKSVYGDQLPDYTDLSPKVRAGWEAAARAVAERL